MGLPVRVVSHPNTDHSSWQHDHLWVLVGGEDYCNGATAFHMGADRDIEGDDLASRNIDNVIVRAKRIGLEVNQDDIREALSDYRRTRETIAEQSAVVDPSREGL
jgi:hypothetical protein